MKKTSLLLILILLCSGLANSQKKTDKFPDAFSQNIKLGRGVNILSSDPIWRSPGNVRFTEDHFRIIKEGGFSSVRVNLHPFRYMDKTNSYKLPESWFKVLDWTIEKATANNLMVILDFHEYTSMADQPEAKKEIFLSFWRQVAPHCKDMPSNVVFELLNEPNGQLTPELWNSFLAEALSIVRETNPNRTVVIGPGFWNQIPHLQELRLPENDRNIIVTIHYYSPMRFTHQGARWVKGSDAWIGTTFGSKADQDSIRMDLQKASEWSKAHNRPVFLGEFGAYEKGNMDSRVKYTSTVARTAEELGFSWAYWQFDSDFIAYDIPKNEWVKPIHDALIPKSIKTSNPLSDQQILDLIKKSRPSNGGDVPANLKNMLGATHMDGAYYFTEQPYIIEGAKKMNELGYGILKLWFAKANGNQGGYRFHSDWKLTRSMTLKDLAQHPYYKEVFGMPFKVFSLNINDGFARASEEDQTQTLNRVENEFYDLTKYLLSEYKNRDVTFILEMWEGDWTLRGGTGPETKWKEVGVPADAPVRVKNFIDWVTARQKGVDRARNEITKSKCKVYHAIEVNRVFDGLEGIPTLTTDVLPKVKVDMVSWSSYDGRTPDGLLMYKGIDVIRDHLNPTPYMNGKKVVFIGEVGKPENINNETRESIREFWDLNMGVYFAQKVPYIIQWELFCNEPKVGPRLQDSNKKAEDMRGFWLIRPDGSKSWAQEYFDELLAKSGKGKK